MRERKMYTGINELYQYQTQYCSFMVLYNECSWYEFRRKKILKEQIDLVFPLMRGELNRFTS